MKKLLRLTCLAAAGIMVCNTTHAQNLNGDDLTLDGAGSNPAIKFTQSDGENNYWFTYTTGAGLYFDKTASFPFFVSENAPGNSLRLRTANVEVNNPLLANDGLEVPGIAEVGTLRVQGKVDADIVTVSDNVSTESALINDTLGVNGLFNARGPARFEGSFDSIGDPSPTFTNSTSAVPSSLYLRSTDSSVYNALVPRGIFSSSTTGAGYMLYGWDDPITRQLVVRGDKNDDPGVGIGTYFPEAELHIYADGNTYETAEFIVENNINTVAIREMFQLINNGGVRFALENTDQGTRWDFTNNTIGDFLVNLAGSGGPEMTVTKGGRFFTGPAGFKAFDARSNGNVWIAGTYNQTSDRTKKENFENVNPTEVLEKLSKIPVTEWNYKNDEDSVRHLGPMAQDFHAAFELGESDRVIALADMFGVSVTAIQALYEQVKDKDAQIESLKEQLVSAKSEQTEKLESLQARMELLEALLLNE